MRRLFFLLYAAYFLQAMPLRAQSYSLLLYPAAGQDSLELSTILKPPVSFSSAPEVLSFLQNAIPRAQEAGYLAAALDSLSIQNGEYEAWVYLGRPYRWARLSTTALPPAVLLSAAITPGMYDGQRLNPKRVAQLSEKILNWADNHGYPFARVWLDSLSVDSTLGISASIMLDKGPLRYIDSIDLQGDVRIAPAFLSRYLDLYIGDVYDESKLRTLSTRIRELPFLKESEPWTVLFTSIGTTLRLNLAEKKANQLNALIGVLPNSRQTGKLLITADVTAAFQNILGYGESISMSYQNLQPRSPRLRAEAAWPYLFDTPFGADGRFDLYKLDSAFRRTGYQLGARYYLNAADYVRIFYEGQSNRVLSVDTQRVRTTRRLPEVVDLNANGGGLELMLERTDYRLSPRRGFSLRVSGAGLSRRVGRTSAIEDIIDGTGFDYGSLYDTLEQRRYQARLSADGSYFIPLGKRLALRLGYSGGYISGSYLFQNELYQIGGFRLLRGFDEQSIFTNHYHAGILELRLLTGGNSYVYLFSDNAWAETRYTGTLRQDVYNGFGLGASLELKNGLFSIGLGLGRSSTIPLELRAAKIYFGYVAVF